MDFGLKMLLGQIIQEVVKKQLEELSKSAEASQSAERKEQSARKEDQK